MKKIIILNILLIFSCDDSGVSPNYGCQDVDAINFDIDANVNDESCLYNYTYTWSNDMKQIFTTCINCHSELTEAYSSIYQSGMIDDLNPDTNDMFRRINLIEVEDEYMPLGEPPLSDENIDKIRIWLLEGAPE